MCASGRWEEHYTHRCTENQMIDGDTHPRTIQHKNKHTPSRTLQHGKLRFTHCYTQSDCTVDLKKQAELFLLFPYFPQFHKHIPLVPHLLSASERPWCFTTQNAPGLFLWLSRISWSSAPFLESRKQSQLLTSGRGRKEREEGEGGGRGRMEREEGEGGRRGRMEREEGEGGWRGSPVSLSPFQ